jgi:uncharacterized protein (DUF849 family)
MLLKACLNGPRLPHEHPTLPVTPDAIGADAAAAVAAGAGAVHVHPKDLDGIDTLDAHAVADVLAAVRESAPGVPVGVTTGAWAQPDPAARRAAIEAWTVFPDFASVNWREPGAADVAASLLEHGIGVEAGLWHPDAVTSWLAWPHHARCTRVLVEVVDDRAPADALAWADMLLSMLGVTSLPVLLHGEGTSAWPVLTDAVRRELDTRVGLEDVLVRPDGTPADGNADLVRAARLLLAR